MGYTYEQLINMGATPGQSPSISPSPQPKKSYTYDELVGLGAQPSQPQQPIFQEPQKTPFYEKVSNTLGFKKATDTFGSLIARSRATPEEKLFIEKPKTRDVIGAVAQTGSLLLPFGTIARGASLAGKALPGILGKVAGSPLVGEVASGIAGAYTYGAGERLQNKEKTVGQALKPTFGDVALGAIPPALIGAGGAAFKALIPQTVKENLARVLKNIGTKNLSQISGGKELDKAVGAFETINKNAPNIRIKDINGVEKMFEPSKATFFELPQALKQTKDSIYNQYTKIAEQAGDSGVLFGQKEFSELEGFLNKYETKGYTPAYSTKANQFKEALGRFGTKNPVDGKVYYKNASPLEIQDLIENVNLDVNPLSDKAGTQVANEFSSELRSLLDNKLEKSGNPLYQATRNQYSQLKSIEKDVVTRYKEVLRKANASPDLIDGISSLDGLMGIVNLEPTNLVRAGLTQALKRVFKYLRNPEVNLQRAFKLLNKTEGKPFLPKTFPKGEFTSPGDIFLKKTKEYAKNPKFGLSIEDVSQSSGKYSQPINFQNIKQNTTIIKNPISPIISQSKSKVKVLLPQSKLAAKIKQTGEQKPTIKLKRDVQVTTLQGEKVTIDADEILKAYESGGKTLLKDGREYIVSKSQYENIKNNSLTSEAKPFAPELKGLEETVKGTQKMAIRDKAYADFDAGKITREQRNKIIDKLGVPNETKFFQYQLPGKKNYTEVIHKDPKFPVKPDESHFGDAASWHRANERTYNGKKVYFVEEIQKGKHLDETTGHPLGKGRYVKAEIQDGLKKAVANDSDYFSWISGEQTSARYNLATQVDNVKWDSSSTLKGGSKTIHIQPKEKSGGFIQVTADKTGKIMEGGQADWKGKKLDEVIGKGLADKIMSKESGTLSGEGLKFGGEWATNLYDKQIKNIVEDVTGGKVEMLDMGLIVDKNTTKFIKEGGGNLSPSKMKVGMEIRSYGANSKNYIITDILGDGKFKAVPKKFYTTKTYKPTDIDNPISETIRPNSEIEQYKETFDVSTKTTTQQGIRLTPEIKAKIRGEAPKFRKLLLPNKTGDK